MSEAERASNRRFALFLTAIVALLAAAFLTALMVGRYRMSAGTFWHALFGSGGRRSTEYSVIVGLRLPRTIVAGLAGAALSLSGLLYQEMFQNKLTSPDLLGVSNGAGVGAAVGIVCGWHSFGVGLSAFVFGVATVLCTVALARMFRNGSTTILLLAGIIMGGLMSSVLSLLKYIAGDEVKLASITYWLMGSFAGSTMRTVRFLLLILPCFAFILAIRWQINVVALGREEAQTKGVHYQRIRLAIIGTATFLTASTVACSGTISWIGLVVPHIVRLLVGRDTTKTIPLSMAGGALFMTVVDILSRTFTAEEIPLSAVTGLLGTGIFVLILFLKKKDYYER